MKIKFINFKFCDLHSCNQIKVSNQDYNLGFEIQIVKCNHKFRKPKRFVYKKKKPNTQVSI